MAVESADRVGRVRVSFPITFSVVVTVIVIVLTLLFWRYGQASFKEFLVFFAAIVASGGQVTASFYTARALSATIESNRENSIRAAESSRLEVERERLQKLRSALEYGRRYNDPSMYHARDVFRSIVTHVGTPDDLITLAESKATNVIHILNFWEEVAIALQAGIVEPTSVRNQFEVIVVQGWQRLTPWIAHHRKARESIEIWSDLERLYDVWKYPQTRPDRIGT